MFILIIVSIVTVWASYRLAGFLVNLQPYELIFDRLLKEHQTWPPAGGELPDRIGMYLHMARAALLGAAAYVVVGRVLYSDAMFLWFAVTRMSVLVKLLLVIATGGIVIYVVWHHVVVGPSSMMTIWTSAHREQPAPTTRDCLIPYMLMLPSSIINILCFLLPLVLVLLGAVYRGYETVLEHGTRIHNRLTLVERVERSRAYTPLVQDLRDSVRVVSLLLWRIGISLTLLITLLAYEYWMGRMVLTTTERLFGVAVFVGSMLAILPIAVLLLTYERIYLEASWLATSTEASAELNLYSPRAILDRERVMTFVFLGALMFTPVASLVKGLLK